MKFLAWPVTQYLSKKFLIFPVESRVHEVQELSKLSFLGKMWTLCRYGSILAYIIFVLVVESSTAGFENLTKLEATSKMLSRQKRYLIFPEGSNLQLVYCLTIGAYGRQGDLVMGTTAALAWELPSKVDSKISNLLHRRTRSVMFPKIEAFLQASGLDGRSCVMRALCEASQRNFSEIGKGTFVQELLHSIFTLPEDGTVFDRESDRLYDYAYQTGGNCQQQYPTCQHSIYNLDF
ncbi:uncharacterized protein [Prorops nasuta]|uniref:uncharacterized protein n=1 Tax=Prorops nasuta TaxID=863751 RepID=UPI0034CE688A